MRLGLMSLLSFSGCLYVGGINHAPEGDILLDNPNPKLNDLVSLRTKVIDEDGDSIRYEWRVEVAPDDPAEEPVVMTLSANESMGPAYNVKGAESLLLAKDEQLSSVAVPVPLLGSYQVILKVSDGQGASRLLKTSFAAKNQAPEKIGLVLDLDPGFVASDHWPDTGFPGGEERYPAHAHFAAWLSVAGSHDHEGDLFCGEGARVSWTLEAPAAAALEYWDDSVPCKPGELEGRLRFRLKGESVDAPLQIRIRADVEDGHDGWASASASLDVVPNRPACILLGPDGSGTRPPVSEGNMRLPVIAAEGYLFEVSWPNDDIEEEIDVSWWVSDPDRDFEPLQQGVEGARFQMAPWFRLPGQKIYLRAVIQDRYSGFPSCSTDEPLCREEESSLPQSCYQWVTWGVEFR